MALVKVVDPNDGREYEYYMDDKLQKQMDNKVKPALTQKDEDYVVCVDGGERLGMSAYASQTVKRIGFIFQKGKQ